MTHAIDMKRLHMGCGEPLQSHLPLLHLYKSLLTPRVRGQLMRLASAAAAVKMITRDQSR
jgi:hypothetical protein